MGTDCKSALSARKLFYISERSGCKSALSARKLFYISERSGGKVNTFTKDGKSYTTRKNSKSAEATADFRKDAASKKTDVKIRLGE